MNRFDMNCFKKTCFKSLTLVGAILIGHALAQTASQPGQQSPQASYPVTSPLPTETLSITGTSPRPLQRVLEGLRLKYGWSVSYEDPQYLSPQDVVDDPRSKGNLIPAGKTFSMDLPPTPSPTDVPPRDKTLQLIVDAYNHSGNPGVFELLNTGTGEDAVSVVGHDKTGDNAASPQNPFLDTLITVPSAERPVVESLDLICKALTDSTHMGISLGVTPRAWVDHTPAKIGGTQVPARTILAQALAASGHPLYWQLLFDPNTKQYLLNVHSVHVPKPPAPKTPSKPPAADAHPSVPNP
jgi:hypothetical protein